MAHGPRQAEEVSGEAVAQIPLRKFPDKVAAGGVEVENLGENSSVLLHIANRLCDQDLRLLRFGLGVDRRRNPAVLDAGKLR
jgi:hypothetical protein